MKRLIGFLAVVVQFSCEPSVTFEEPQPAGASALKQFPSKLHGSYRSLEDNAILKITASQIIRIYNDQFQLHKHSLDYGWVFKNNYLIRTNTGESHQAKIKGDSIFAFFHAIDTVFAISPENMLTKQKGQYFLNTNYGENTWGVQKMALHKNLLAIYTVSRKADLAKLCTIAAAEIDSAQKFKPTRKQFKEFVKMEGFGDEEIFLKTP